MPRSQKLAGRHHSRITSDPSVRHELRILDGAHDVTAAGAAAVLDSARRAARGAQFSFAVSGGSTPWAMFEALAGSSMPWDRTRLLQVDERIAPAGDPARNLTHLTAALAGTSVRLDPMPVDEPDLEAAAQQYAAALPAQIDLVHLGLGADGHTASLVPGDPVLDVSDRPVAVTTQPYQGHRRMTLTYLGLRRARQLLWLVVGEDKAAALAALMAHDAAVPAGRVTAERSMVLADAAAASAVSR